MLDRAHLEHTKEPGNSIEGVVTLREAALNFLPDAVLELDAVFAA
jgi:hypothetical protein